MRRMFACVMACAALWSLGAATTNPETRNAEPETRFSVVDLFVDSGAEMLAVWQVEMKATAGDVKIVGIESGGQAAYKEPPFYDPAAMMGGRVILGAYSLDDEALPAGKTRVARLHVQITGDAKPQYETKLTVAAAKAGKPIAAKVTVAEGEGQ